MPYATTTALRRIVKMNKRVKIVQGGARAGKSVAILMVLIHKAQTNKNLVISVVSESVPHLKRGVMRDFLQIMQTPTRDDDPAIYYREKSWNRTDYIYRFETGSIIEFFSTDNPGKVRGPARDVLFINEANNIPYETYEQLAIRTTEDIYLDFNPVATFWAHEKVAPRDDAELIILTYKDNEALHRNIVAEIESRKANKAFWTVYGLGLVGELTGKIFSNWQIIDEIPHEARLEVGGGDFGFARDKTAFCDIYKYNGGYIIDEIVARVGLKDTDLANMLTNRSNSNLLYIADSADSQKILTLNEMGVNATGVVKSKGAGGENFTNAAIGFVQDQRISVTKRSANYIESYRNFMWQTDKDGNVIPKYDHYKSDEMMSVVYGMTAFSPREEDTEVYTTGDFASSWI